MTPQHLAPGGLFLQKEGAEQENPQEAGGGDAGQHGDGHLNQRHLVQRQGQEQKPVSHDAPPVQELPDEALPLRLVIGLLLQQNLAGGGHQHSDKRADIADVCGKDARIRRSCSPPFQ